LLLVDIRYEKIYWEKEIPARYDISFNAILDSVLFFLKDYRYSDTLRYISKIAFQALDDRMFQVNLKPKKIDLISEAWGYDYEIRVRPWKGGLILANSRYYGIGNGNNYALLDTMAGTMELWQPSGEFGWLNECTDAKWSSIGGLCLKEIPDTLGFVLLRNGVDTLAVRYMPHKLFVADHFANSMRLLVFTGNSIISWGWVYLMGEQGQVSENPLDVWVYQMGTFRDFYGNEVDYNKKIVY